MILLFAGIGIFVTVFIFGAGIKAIIDQHKEMNEKDGE